MNKDGPALVVPARLIAAIDAELLATTRRSPRVSLMVVDVDGMSEINAVYGHDRGDYFLAVVRRELCAAIPQRAVMADLGGDAFAIALPKAGQAAGARRALSVVRRLGRDRLRLSSEPEVPLRVSVGGASCTSHDSAMSMLRDAHDALVAAKRHRGGTVVWNGR